MSKRLCVCHDALKTVSFSFRHAIGATRSFHFFLLYCVWGVKVFPCSNWNNFKKKKKQCPVFLLGSLSQRSTNRTPISQKGKYGSFHILLVEERWRAHLTITIGKPPKFFLRTSIFESYLQFFFFLKGNWKQSWRRSNYSKR